MAEGRVQHVDRRSSLDEASYWRFVLEELFVWRFSVDETLVVARVLHEEPLHVVVDLEVYPVRSDQSVPEVREHFWTRVFDVHEVREHFWTRAHPGSRGRT